jgi:hypothetical protein
MKLYVFGNGNLSMRRFLDTYYPVLEQVHDYTDEVLVCDFRGVDVMTMEAIKTMVPTVTVFHQGKRPRYLPDRHLTFVDRWKLVGGFKGDEARDAAAIEACTHFLAFDRNSTPERKSGTQRNIEKCLALGKVRLGEIDLPQ